MFVIVQVEKKNTKGSAQTLCVAECVQDTEA